MTSRWPAYDATDGARPRATLLSETSTVVVGSVRPWPPGRGGRWAPRRRGRHGRLPWVILVPDRARASAYTSGACLAAAATSTSPQGSASTCLPDSACWNRASHDVGDPGGLRLLGRRAGRVGAARAAVATGDAGRRPSSLAGGALTSARGRVALVELADRVGHGRVHQPGQRPGAGGHAEVEDRGELAALVQRVQPGVLVGDPAVGLVEHLVPDRHHERGVDGLAAALRGTYGRKVRARPSATVSRPSALVPRACTPNQ